MPDPLVHARAAGTDRMAITVTTDGTTKNSAAVIVRDGVGEAVDAEHIWQASCSVAHLPGGCRCITATVWTQPPTSEGER